MKLKKLFLYNFRNHKTINFTFSKNLIFFTGGNASGKTNILEAIYFLSTNNSFKTSKLENLININSSLSKITAELETEDENLKIEVETSRYNKSNRWINSNKIYRITDFLGKIKSVIYSPDDIDIIRGEPEKRRNFLDIEIPQIKPPYFFFLRKFYKALQQRNKLFKEIKEKTAEHTNKDIFDNSFCENGAYLIEKRADFVNQISKYFNEIYNKISGKCENLRINYISSPKLLCYQNREEIKKMLLENLRKNYDIDIELGKTTVGPQKDDIEIYLDNKNLRHYGSFGEQKTAAVSIKLAEAKYIELEFKTTPIILFDDLFSELDKNRVFNIINLLQESQNYQIFTTSTELPKNIDIQDYEVFEI